jgi:hypothetical protein
LFAPKKLASKSSYREKTIFRCKFDSKTPFFRGQQCMAVAMLFDAVSNGGMPGGQLHQKKKAASLSGADSHVLPDGEKGKKEAWRTGKRWTLGLCTS